MDNQNTLGKMAEFNTLVDMIVDYYCFKNNMFEEEQDENEHWKKGTKYEEAPIQEIIPSGIDKLIETAFSHQLKKFTKD
jgi:L-lysine 2,3-aminomutase